MTTESAVAVLESVTTAAEARAALRDPPPGLSDAFFRRVVELSQQAPHLAARLASHWRTVRDLGDDPGLAYRAKAVGERSEGKWRASARSFLQAGQHAPDRIRSLEYQIGAVDSLARAARIEEAIELGSHLADRLSKAKRRDLAARVRLNLANACLWADDYARARAFAAKARGDLERAGMLVERAAADLALSTAELFGGSAERAETIAREAASTFESLGLSHYVDLCRVNEAQALRIRGHADEALTVLLAVRQNLSGGGGPELARVTEFLGHTYFALNLWREATDAYGSALEMKSLADMPINVANCHYGRGQVSLALGDLDGARRSFSRARSIFAKSGNDVWVAAALLGMADANLMSGKYEAAERIAHTAVSLLPERAAEFHRCKALLVAAEAALQRRTLTVADVARLRRRIQSLGLLPLTWKALEIEAQTQTGKKRIETYRKMFDAILELRALTRTTIARAAAFNDKERATSAYLEALLERPTPERVDEAVEVVTRSRSVALLDEILSAASITERQAQDLRELRDTINAELSSLEPPSNSRRGPARSQTLARLSRSWIEAIRVPMRAASRLPNASEYDSTVFVRRPSGIAALRNRTLFEIHASLDELTRLLRAARYEILAPMTDDSCRPSQALSIANELRSKLLTGWESENELNRIAPFGLLWSAPWSLILEDIEAEAELLPSPAFNATSLSIRIPKDPSVAIWASESKDLPRVSDELQAILSVFPNAVVCRSAAQVRELFSGCAFDLIHVAGHGVFSEENPMFSHLVFEDGDVFAGEIARSKLKVGLATLSACDTAAMSTSNIFEADGLARAFLARGAQAVVGSQWPLDDRAAEVAMPAILSALASGTRLSEAVAGARSNLKAAFEHPYYWAGLVILPGLGQRFCKEQNP
ncbi:MAG: hypothetical protein AKCLJLPJ_00739 [Fimbriimonadales bacterium]|nr:hypothetical protein [Fimbriimonadales bacterium]